MKYDYMKNQNIQIRKGWKALLWKQVKSRMESSYSELVLVDDNDIDNLVVNICSVVGSIYILVAKCRYYQMYEIFLIMK